ncbi:MAG: hypothetical protein U0835_10940 [Isosphaeraceae bacterium]
MTRFVKYPEGGPRDAALVVLVSVVLPLALCWLYVRETISTAGFVALLGGGVATLLGLFTWLERKGSVTAEVVPGKAAGAKTWDGPAREFRPDGTHFATVLLGTTVLLGYVVFLAWLMVSGGMKFRGAADLSGSLAMGVVAVLLTMLSWASINRLSLEPDGLHVTYPLLGRSRNRSIRYAEIDSVESSRTRYGRQVRIKPSHGSPVMFLTGRSDVADDLLDALRQRVAASKPVAVDDL